MQYFRGATAAELIALRVDAGEDLVGAVEKTVSDLGIAAGAIVSGTGTLEHIHLEVPATMTWPATALPLEKQGPGQIISAQGTVTSAGMELMLTVAKRNEIFAGKAMPGTKVLHSAELMLLRAGGTRWVHVPEATTGVPLLRAAAPPPAAPVTLMGRPIDPAAVALVPAALIRKHGCLPVARAGDTLVVAMTDPSNPFAIDDLREATGMRIQTVAVPARELMPALQQVLST